MALRSGSADGYRYAPVLELTTVQDESELVKAVQSGNQGALGELLDAYQHRIYNVCLRMLSNRDDAAEVAQESMLKVIQHIGEFKGKSRVGTWIIRIAMNQAVSQLRKRKLRQTVSLDATDNDQATPMSGQLPNRREPTPESNVEKKELIAFVKVALSQIDDEFRAVLVLRDNEQMDYQQIAEVLAVPVGTVKSRLFRARLALRQRLQRLCPSSPFDEQSG